MRRRQTHTNNLLMTELASDENFSVLCWYKLMLVDACWYLLVLVGICCYLLVPHWDLIA